MATFAKPIRCQGMGIVLSTLVLSCAYFLSHSGGNVALALTSRASIVTGANGYVGREVVRALVQNPETSQCIYCLVRPARIDSENKYWRSQEVTSNCNIEVLPYDMNDGGETVYQAMKTAAQRCDNTCVYHIASVFGPSDDPIATAKENVKGTEDLVETMAKFPNSRLVLTSSMAAVRGTSQDPLNGSYYTNKDWNTVSELGENWGGCYQWSKAESERRAWELSKSLNIPMSSICPSFVFGPPSDTSSSSNSFSVALVGRWVCGESPVQSRLCVDVRDVATAHVAAGVRDEAIGERFIVSTEERVPSLDMAEVLKKVCRETNRGDSKRITHDAEFQGGVIPIGEREVEAAERLEKHLGVTLRPAQDTMSEMGRSLLQAAASESEIQP